MKNPSHRHMNISVERLPECKANINVEIDADQVTETRNSIVSAFTSQAQVPGYRPGKTPQKVVEKRFARPIQEELTERLLGLAFGKVQEDEKLPIIGIETIGKQEVETDGRFVLEAEVITEPDFELSDYKGISVEVPKREVTDELVTDYLTQMQKYTAEREEVERAAAAGDRSIVSYTATLKDAAEGEDLEALVGENGKILITAEDHTAELPAEGADAQEFIPGLAAAIVGMQPNETKSFEATFADDFGLAELQGRTLTYDLTLNKVEEYQLTELDDKFAETFGAESLEELQGRVREQYQSQFDQEKNQIIENQILTKLNEEHSFDLPQHMVFNETQRQVNEMVMRGYQQGISQEQVAEQQEALMSNAQQTAMQNVKTLFLVEQIAENEGIKVSDEEVYMHIQMMAQQEQRPLKKVMKELQQKNAIGQIKQQIVFGKTVELLRSEAQITEVEAEEA